MPISILYALEKYFLSLELEFRLRGKCLYYQISSCDKMVLSFSCPLFRLCRKQCHTAIYWLYFRPKRNKKQLKRNKKIKKLLTRYPLLAPTYVFYNDRTK